MPIWTRRRAAERTYEIGEWSRANGFDFDPDEAPVDADSLLARGWGRSTVCDVATRADGVSVRTVLIRAGKGDNHDVQLASVRLRRGPGARMTLQTKPAANARLLAPLAALAGFDHVHGVDARLERRWIVFANDGTRAHVALAADTALVRALCEVEPPSWHKWAKDDGPWAIALPETLRTWRNSRIELELSADALHLAVDGRCPVRRAAAVEVATALAALIDGR